jgi:hypothetical protein
MVEATARSPRGERTFWGATRLAGVGAVAGADGDRPSASRPAPVIGRRRLPIDTDPVVGGDGLAAAMVPASSPPPVSRMIPPTMPASSSSASDVKQMDSTFGGRLLRTEIVSKVQQKSTATTSLNASPAALPTVDSSSAQPPLTAGSTTSQPLRNSVGAAPVVAAVTILPANADRGASPPSFANEIAQLERAQAELSRSIAEYRAAAVTVTSSAPGTVATATKSAVVDETMTTLRVRVCQLETNLRLHELYRDVHLLVNVLLLLCLLVAILAGSRR